MVERITVSQLRNKKSKGEKIVMVTAYDATLSEILDQAGVDVILVGDSLGNVIFGYETTIPVTLAQVIHHVRAVKAGVTRALVVADLPFGTYQAGVEKAVASAVELMQAGADAVKLEGAYLAETAAITKAGIPVMGHLGYTPQSVNVLGGHRVQGRGDKAGKMIETAKALESEGAFGIVLELIPSQVAADISQAVSIPTIGIGAGVHCDGQVQVLTDILGIGAKKYRHSANFMNGRELITEAISKYISAVQKAEFPTSEQSFS